MRLGIFGGTFDPIHFGHLSLAQHACQKLHLDKVIFVPSYLPPHKNSKEIAKPVDRLKMVRLATKDNPDFEVSSFEVDRPGKSYSIETIKFFKSKFPKARLFFIIGSDSLTGLKDWKGIHEFLKLVDLIVVNRPGNSTRAKHIKYFSVTMPGLAISSSYVRESLKGGRSVRYLVPDAVRKYIERNKIY